ncbi:unnamed protein product [Lathyrus oleraceus]|uniref:HXXXD-type acyl-transferase family protein n=1 Tax=Pisum sativum TaxID=3888 RepID=A0A9D4XIN1_PEA|nr:uncharacterized acetyltransferase At3g50280-like [Pisum sativum]KAI5421083.1 hypothetical protein KIW84_044793 [Pisum sativum]
MSSLQVLSTTTIHAPNHPNHHTIHLTPWDLQFLPFEYNQFGYLYHHPTNLDVSNQIEHLKNSFTSTLHLLHPLTGRLKITHHEDNTISCSINCNNDGALFVHAVAENITVADIFKVAKVTPIHHSFYAMNGFKNYNGTSQPLLAVQVTELVDGIFIGCTINHVTGDGNLFAYFINSWARFSKGCVKMSTLPIFERWFPKGIECPIRFPFKIEQQSNLEEKKLNPSERIFHFTKENIAKLKFKANLEAGTTNISSLQALFTHLWRSFIRSKELDPQTDVKFVLDIGVKKRLVPQLPENYYGVAVIECVVSMKAGELLGDGGLGKGALEMNKIIALHNDEKLRSEYKNWLTKPSFTITRDDAGNVNSLVIGSSPWFEFYESDFGWGKPVGVRSGYESKRNGKVYVYGCVEKGNMELEVCQPYEILVAMGNDPEFMMELS